MNIKMNYFDEWIIDELIHIGIINTLENIQMVSWFPVAPYDNYSCAIRLARSVSNNQIVQCGIFNKIDIINNYINMSIDDEILSNKVSAYVSEKSDYYGITKFDCMYKGTVVVEHTSQTPSYPINLATFRGSVIGNVLVSILKKFRVPVSIHYLVADTSRNIDLILKNYSIEEIFSLKEDAKADHLCGVLFCKSLFKIKEPRKDLNIYEMFPLVNKKLFEIKEENVLKEKYSKDDIKRYCEFCLQGHTETLKNAHINIDLYDYESKAIKEINFDAFVDLEIAKRNLAEDKISYLWVNCAYYSYLAKDYSAIISVINNRQEQKFNEILSNLNEKVLFMPLFYGDIKFSENGTIMVDSIKNGKFHSVDEYVRKASKILSVDCNTIYDALKLLLLSKRYNQPISLDISSFNDLKKYVEIITFIRREIDNMKKTNSVSAYDAILARYLINAYSVFEINNICPNHDFSICNAHKIVNYIEMVVRYMREKYSEFINRNIAIASKQVLENALSLIGI